MKMQRTRIFAFLIIIFLLSACNGGTVTEFVEVTRVTTETVEVEGETLEVTRVVVETVEVEVPAEEQAASGQIIAPLAAADSNAALPAATSAASLNLESSVDDSNTAAGSEGDSAGGEAAAVLDNEEVNAETPPLEPAGNQFEDYGVNAFFDSAEDPLSTFAVDVDTGSFVIARRYLKTGFLPPSDAVRVEEFVNYFAYDYSLPPADEGFAIHLEGGPSPYGVDDSYHLVRVGIQGFDVNPQARPDATLIFVIDISGSMDHPLRLGLVQDALELLLESLRPTDRVGIVVYGNHARPVLEPTVVAAHEEILSAINNLHAEGSTNVQEGLAVAYAMADRNAEPGRITRLILLSDGVANVGATTADAILQHGQNGIPLNTYGVGLGGYNDVLMEQLADQGNGVYAYLDTLEEAQRLFQEHLTASIFTIARDAKIQVMFNPAVVAQYRLLGYENRAVADADFRNDDVDAGEIGAGHSVTALYEVRLVENAPPAQAALTVQLRYADPESGEVREQAQSIAVRDFAADVSSTSPTFQLAAVIAEFAEMLRNSYWAQENDFASLAQDAWRIAGYFPNNPNVQDFAALVNQAAGLAE